MILVDTGPLYALAMRRDALHERAHEELVALRPQGLMMSTSNLLETQSLLLRRETPAFVSSYINALLKGNDLINPSTEDYLQAQTLLGRFEDQRISLFDAVLVVLSETLNLPIWTFDTDFDVMRARVWRA